MSTTLATLTLANPGFETGAMSGWQRSTATCQPLTTAGGVQPPRSGSWMLWAGNVDAVNGNSAWQDFDVSAFASEIDAETCTIQGFQAWHQTIATQGDNGGLYMEFYDGSNVLLLREQVQDATSRFGTGWHLVEFAAPLHATLHGAVTVPANTRKVRLGCYNFIGVGPSIQSFWDDFVDPTLVTSLDEGGGGGSPVTHDAALDFLGEGAFALDAVIYHFAQLDFRGLLSLGLSPTKFPLFECPAPPVKVWTRGTVAAKSWACATVAPAEECDGIDTTTSDDLDVVAGDRLTTIDGYGLKLVS